MPHTDPEKRKAYHREWYLANREKKLAQGKAWSQANRAKCVERTQRYLAKGPDRRYAYHIKSTYGITLDDYKSMLDSQGGGCAICGLKAEDARNGRLVVDHMHCSGKVRSLLCHRCNSAIGMLQDDPELVDKAAAYIRKHRNEIH